MNKTRRSFLRALAATPFIGSALVKAAEPNTPATIAPQISAEPVYGFDEQLTLNAVSGGEFQYIAAEDLRRGELVRLTNPDPQFGQYGVAKARLNDHPVGMVMEPIAGGEEAGGKILVRGSMRVMAGGTVGNRKYGR